MDRRFKPMTATARRAALETALSEVVDHPEWGPVGGLRHLKRSLHLTTQELADAAGISARTVQDLEQGRSSGTVRTLNQLLAVFGLQLTVQRAPPRSAGS